jgi:hypothetical protein
MRRVCVLSCRRYPAARAVGAKLTDWMTVYGWPLKSLWNAPIDMYYYAFPELDMTYEVCSALVVVVVITAVYCSLVATRKYVLHQQH